MIKAHLYSYTALWLGFILAWPVALPGQAGLQAQQGAQSVPAVDQVLESFVKAIGGKAAVQKLSSRVIKGTVEMAGLGSIISWESYSKAPAKQLSVLEIPGIGTFLEGCNGKLAWAKNPMVGLREKSGDELAKARRDAHFYRDISFKSIYANLTCRGLEKVSGEDAYVLEARPSASSLERFYFSAKSGLLVRQDSEFENADGKGKTQVQASLEDHRSVDGVKIPFTIHIRADVPGQPQATLTISFTEVKHNVPIDDAKFEKPDA
jgi:hypothetical protein